VRNFLLSSLAGENTVAIRNQPVAAAMVFFVLMEVGFARNEMKWRVGTTCSITSTT
jgi:hypothetical protein